MSIVRHEGLQQITCDSCPAAFGETYADEDFGQMIADVKAARWLVRPVNAAAAARNDRSTQDLFGSAPRIAGGKAQQKFTHTCPACAKAARDQRGSLI
ncbi:hypothetical protein EET67_09690 [Pseudaminobacter arsenicus]|uniref:Uncharacterized protein n=1 Tax=Borborobacter arsenicus TaxID=1851146 RepID=A0A432V6S3_9HYPH|nr:hypothetical protein [Pseudaminobacter arsenicus]RUM97882.1 hypothetical protein EET67_09690 [Pseudaminobacter arsenicus]